MTAIVYDEAAIAAKVRELGQAVTAYYPDGDLLVLGLLKGSFIPSEVLRELRDLTRYRTKLRDEHTSEVNRVH